MFLRLSVDSNQTFMLTIICTYHGLTCLSICEALLCNQLFLYEFQLEWSGPLL